jgi:hypothetical protein
MKYLLLLLTLLFPISTKATTVITGDPSVFIIDGRIDKNTWEDFTDRLPRIKTIILKSNGGIVVYASAIARLIRSFKLTTIARANCFSACVLIFQSGHKRIAYKNAVFMMHPVTVYYDDRIEKDPELTVRFVLSLIHYGLKRYTLPIFTQGMEIYFSSLEALEFNIATEVLE